MAQEFHITTAHNVDLGYETAPLGDRIMAFLIDAVIQYSYVLMVYLVFTALNGPLDLGEVDFALFAILLIPYFFYHFLFEIFNNGQSPGKRSFRLRVVNTDGTNVNLGSYVLRWLFRVVDITFSSGVVAIIAIAVSEKAQRLGGMVSGTTVVRQQRQFTLDQLAYQEQEPDYQTTYPQVMRLNSKHIEVIKETLDNLHITDTSDHVELLATKISTKMEVEFEEHPRKFLRTVVKDYSRFKS